MAHNIRFSDEADEHLDDLTARQRARVVDAIEEQLLHEPTKITRAPGRCGRTRRPALRPGNCGWTICSVYYDVKEEPRPLVKILAIGVKVRNRVLIGGRKIEP